MIMEYCVSELQEMLECAPEKKFPIWQAHWWVANGSIRQRKKGKIKKFQQHYFIICIKFFKLYIDLSMVIV